MNLSDLENSGVVFKKFCGLDIEDSVGCPNEAVGDITTTLEDGMEVPIPICQVHLDIISSKYDVEYLSLG